MAIFVTIRDRNGEVIGRVDLVKSAGPLMPQLTSARQALDRWFDDTPDDVVARWDRVDISVTRGTFEGDVNKFLKEWFPREP